MKKYITKATAAMTAAILATFVGGCADDNLTPYEDSCYCPDGAKTCCTNDAGAGANAGNAGQGNAGNSTGGTAGSGGENQGGSGGTGNGGGTAGNGGGTAGNGGGTAGNGGGTAGNGGGTAGNGGGTAGNGGGTAGNGGGTAGNGGGTAGNGGGTAGNGGGTAGNGGGTAGNGGGTAGNGGGTAGNAGTGGGPHLGDPCNSFGECQGLAFCCGGHCIDPNANAQFCGDGDPGPGYACGPTCTGGKLFCQSGTCTAGCSGTYANCGDNVCRDLSTDEANCDGCGIKCSAGQVCVPAAANTGHLGNCQ